MIEISDIEKELEDESIHSGDKLRAVVVRLDTVKSEPIKWLWQGRIALGKLTLITGDPGLGKSLITAYLAAVVSKGYRWAVDETECPIGDVVMLSAEDDAADTTKPRLEAAEADCSRIHVLQAVKDADSESNRAERMFSFKRDMAVLEELLTTLPECRLLIIDPISAYMDGTDSNNNSDVRSLFAPLAALATRNKIAVVCISHLNKSSGSNAVYRSIGSVAFIAAARAAYVVTKDQQNPQRRLFLPSKNNLAQDTAGLAYSVITADNGAPVVAWEPQPVATTADEALAPFESNGEHTATDEATDFLRELLPSGSMNAKQIQQEARQAGISEKVLRRAKEKLGIKSWKSAAFAGGWVWGYPEDALGSEDAQPKTEGILDDTGHLGADDG